MAKEIKAFQIGDPISWKSHEGIKGNGSGEVVDAWQNAKGVYCITAKNSSQCVCLLKSDLV